MHVTRSRLAMRAATLAAASALVLSACAALPQGPAALPSTFIPRVSTSAAPLAPGVFEGFTALERVAMRVRVRTCTEYLTGSAWVLDAHHAVTNRHVVTGATDIALTSFDGHTYTGTVAVIDPTADLALITVKETLPDIATIASSGPAVGDVLTIAGYPEGQSLAVTKGPFRGLVNDNLEKTKAKVYQIEAPSRHGSSGSPIANAAGAVVGVLYASDNQDVSLAVSLPTLRDFLSHLNAATVTKGACPAQA